MDDRLDEKYSRILEGMFRGITEKIREAQTSMEKEFRYGVSQQGFSHDTLSKEVKEESEKLLTEIKYLAQQNFDIYDYSRKEHAALQEGLIRAMDERNAMLLKAIDERIPALAPAPAPAPAEIDYDLLAEKVAALLKASEEIAAPAEPSMDGEEDEPAPEVTAETAETAETGETAETEVTAETAEESAAEAEAAAADATSSGAEAADFDDSGFLYDILAEKIASILPEPDYDTIADKVAASLPVFDADVIAQKVAEAVHTDSGALAGELAEAVPPVDYELIGEKVAEALEDRAFGDETAENIARRVAELLKGDEGDLERIAEETEPAPSPETAEASASAGDTPDAQSGPATEPESGSAPQAEPELSPAPSATSRSVPMTGYIPVVPPMSQAVPFYVPVPVAMPASSPSEPSAEPAAPAAPAVPVPEDESKTVRYKRSFVAKIIGSEEEVKTYYSDLKNAILSYGKVRSQINWTNDRFFIGNDSIIKIGVRGRTLVVYLALDPKEFPETVYHQKFAGDTKMYEMTPMMVKVKTKAAVKKAIRLIDLCMERYGAVKEEREPVDYAAQYFFRTDEELLAEGLIKTAIVDKSDMDF